MAGSGIARATPVASHSGTWNAARRSLQEGGDAPGAWRQYEPLELPPVLMHSLEAFAEHGYHGTSVREIAQRLGQTVPAIYYHFENKQALLVTLLRGSMEEVLQRCQLAVDEVDGDGVDRFCSLITCVVSYIANRKELILLDAEIRSLEPDNRRDYISLRDQLEQMVIEAVAEGVAVGAFTTRHPREAARAVLTMCLGIANWYDPRARFTSEDLAELYIDFALGTVGQRC